MTENISPIDYEIFISYRRNGGDILAKLLYETLRNKKYSVFFDHESLSSGVFGEKILSTIRGSKDVVVVLSKDCLNRCKVKDDWMFLEVREAIETNKNITLVFSEDFSMPSSQELLEYPKEIQKLLTYQGYLINIEHFDNTLKKICDGFASHPLLYTENDAHQAASFLLKNALGMFYQAQKLKTVIGVLDFSRASNTGEMFVKCLALENVRCASLKQDISFADSPLLSKESLLYMINNCASDATFTITLHPDV